MSQIFLYLFYAFLGILPSAIWLLFYLREDNRPEPNSMILKIFFWGGMMGPLAISLQLLAMHLSQPTFFGTVFFVGLDKNSYLFLLNIVLFAPLIEEYLKYMVVKWKILKNPVFDEPLDTMIYLIISALGFAAVENLLNIFLLGNLTVQAAVSQSIARFLSATLLHALSSGILGYFLAHSLFNLKKRTPIFWIGFLTATGFHSLYNFFVWLADFNKLFIIAMAILLAMGAILVNWQFRRLKKQLSICKIIPNS